MKLSANECLAFCRAMFDPDSKEKIALSPEQEDAFLAFGNKLIDESRGRGLSEVDLPPQFLPLYRQYQKTKGYCPDVDSLMLQVEQREQPRSFNIPDSWGIKTTTKDNVKSNFLEKFGQFTSQTKSAFEGIEFARRGGNEEEMAFAYHRAFAAAAAERKMSCGDPVARILQDPEKQEIFEFVGKIITKRDDPKCILNKYDQRVVQKVFSPGITPSDDFGGGMFFSAPVSADVLYASYEYSGWKDLGWRVLAGARMRYAKITQPGQALFITPENQGKTMLTSDVFISGDQVTELANTIGILFEISGELFDDGKTALSEAVLRALSEGHGKALDYASFQGNGNDDPQNGTQTGIFMDQKIASVNAAQGEQSVLNLSREDFIAVISAVAPSALTRDPRWYISPAFLPKLLQLKDPAAKGYLLKTPSETEGDFELVGFPVTWSNGCPGNDMPGQKVAAFGAPDGYLVALQAEMEVLASDTAKWASNIRQMRGLNRGRVETRESTWFATLKLSQQQ